MKRALFAFVAAAILVAFTAPSFAGDDKKKEEKKGGHFREDAGLVEEREADSQAVVGIRADVVGGHRLIRDREDYL